MTLPLAAGPLAATSASTVVNGTLGFLVVAGLAVAMVVLFRSMSKHLRKVNNAAQEDRGGAPPGQQGDGSASP
jgi:hypothetical protein